MPDRPRKVTQREIARIAGVSQATVSLVLNDRDGRLRIAEQTRARVLRAIEQTTYVPDSAARRLAGLGNRIIGVFTYEPALDPHSLDFYGPLLNGIERAAEVAGCDLLFFTSSPVVGGRRQLLAPGTRLRLADGVVLFGQEMDSSELERLAADGFPFVAVGRRDEADVPYVGVDYRTPTVELLTMAAHLGHRRAVYVHNGRDSPAARDRLAQIRASSTKGPIRISTLSVPDGVVPPISKLLAGQPTLILGDDGFRVEAAASALMSQDPAALDRLSFAALIDVPGHTVGGRQLTGFHTPREEVAATALSVLLQIIETNELRPQGVRLRQLLTAVVDPGQTLRETGERSEAGR